MTVTFIAAASLLLYQSFGLSKASGWMPQAILLGTLALLLLQLGIELIGVRRNARVDGAPEHEAVRHGAVLPVFAWIGSLLLAIGVFGVVIGVVSFCLAYLRWQAAESWRVCITFALSLGLAIQLIFSVLLQSALYPGIFP